MKPSAPQVPVDIVVPVYGGWEFVERCLTALELQTVPVTVTVVDDASPDDVAERIAERFPQFRLLRNDMNVGFARSCNRGIKAGIGDVVILVNSDVVAVPTMAERIADAFRDPDDARVGSAAPLLLQQDGRVDAFGVCADITLAGFVRYHGADATTVRAGEPAVIGPYGALAGYRRRALERVGYLDENFFMYGEELELAFRLAADEWAALAIQDSLGTHVGGASAGAGSPRQRYLAGFGRGYILRVYDVLQSRHAARAIATEAIVVGIGIVRYRDLAQLRGRRDGWRRGKGVSKRRYPTVALDSQIGFVQSLRMRGASFWTSRR